jgi:hypothetical protein
MSASISRKNGWGGAREAFDKMLAELHHDIERPASNMGKFGGNW